MAETKTVTGASPVGSPTTYLRFQLDNHLGTCAVEVTEDGSVISYEEYHPYGTSAHRAQSNSVDVSAKRYRYTGKERDEETGLYYHGARYYAPWLGRWTAADPLAFADGTGGYTYARNEPTNLADPGGKQVLPQDDRPFFEKFPAHEPTGKDYAEMFFGRQAIPGQTQGTDSRTADKGERQHLGLGERASARYAGDGRPWYDVGTPPPKHPYKAAPSTAADAALDARVAREGGAKDFRLVPAEDAVDHMGRPFWDATGTRANIYHDFGDLTSVVEVGLAVGGLAVVARAFVNRAISSTARSPSIKSRPRDYTSQGSETAETAAAAFGENPTPPTRWQARLSNSDVQRLAEKRASLRSAGRKRNVANLHGTVGEVELDLSAASGENTSGPKPATRRFRTGKVKQPGQQPGSRAFDSEALLLEEAAEILGRGEAGRGELTLISEGPFCDSCVGVIQQFENYTGIRLIIRSGRN